MCSRSDFRQHRSFNEDDVSFLQNYANLIAAAIDRLKIEADLKQAADRTSFLLGELQHRVQNMLLNVRSLARRTAKGSTSLSEFSEAFDARLMALARTQDLLTGGSVASVRLEDALRQELRAHGVEPGGRVSLSGPDVRLSPKTVRALSMVFHELATNASKYGALHHDGGRLDVSWRATSGDEDEEVLVTWRESGYRSRLRRRAAASGPKQSREPFRTCSAESLAWSSTPTGFNAPSVPVSTSRSPAS